MFFAYVLVLAVSIILEYHKDQVSADDNMMPVRIFFKIVNLLILMFHFIRYELP